MEPSTFPILELIALAGVIFGPALGYFGAKRQSEAGSRLIDAQTLAEIAEGRKKARAEIADLNQLLLNEQEERRLERERYLNKIDALTNDLRNCTKALEE